MGVYGTFTRVPYTGRGANSLAAIPIVRRGARFRPSGPDGECEMATKAIPVPATPIGRER
jgi:hypothetical protein